MTQARAENVPADPATARVFLKRARDFARDAAKPDSAPASSQVLAWQICISAMEAILLAAGRRVTPGDGAHVLRLKEAERSLPDEHGTLFERLDSHRELRHEASYHAGVVSEAEVEVTIRDAQDLLDVAEAFVEAPT